MPKYDYFHIFEVLNTFKQKYNFFGISPPAFFPPFADWIQARIYV